MPHNVKIVMDAFIAHLETNITVDVIRNRVNPADEQPAIGVSMGNDEPDLEISTLAERRRRLTVNIELLTFSNTTADLDGDILALREQFEAALVKFNHALVSVIWPWDVDQPEYAFDGENPAALTRMAVPMTYLEKIT